MTNKQKITKYDKPMMYTEIIIDWVANLYANKLLEPGISNV